MAAEQDLFPKIKAVAGRSPLARRHTQKPTSEPAGLPSWARRPAANSHHEPRAIQLIEHVDGESRCRCAQLAGRPDAHARRTAIRHAARRVPARADDRRERLRHRLSRERLEARSPHRDQGIPADHTRRARQRLGAPRAARTGPCASLRARAACVHRRSAGARALRSPVARACAAQLGSQRHRLPCDAVLRRHAAAHLAPGARRAARRSLAAIAARRPARCARGAAPLGSHSPRDLAGQHPAAARRSSGAARLQRGATCDRRRADAGADDAARAELRADGTDRAVGRPAARRVDRSIRARGDRALLRQRTLAGFAHGLVARAARAARRCSAPPAAQLSACALQRGFHRRDRRCAGNANARPAAERRAIPQRARRTAERHRRAHRAGAGARSARLEHRCES